MKLRPPHLSAAGHRPALSIHKRATAIVAALAVAALQAGSATLAQETVQQDSIDVPAFSLPFSDFISEAAKQDFRQQKEYIAKVRAETKASNVDPASTEGILRTRKRTDNLRRGIAQDMLKDFPVTVAPEKIGGVQTEVVVPQAGVAAQHKNRVLINVHGGGFIFGARWEGQVGAIPISGTGGYKVITVDYRMAPEYTFPAASEDVAKVYSELLKQYRPENIGIFGCSAGGMLTAQSVAWFQKHGLPRPGAIIIEGAGAAFGQGDSTYFVTAQSGTPLKPGERRRSVYFKGVDMKDPLVTPASSPEVLAHFPPTLILSAMRDQSVSGALYTHTQLIKAGVDADLHVWEGMGHCFTYNHKLPESREAYDVEVKFFDKHLGSAAK